MVQGPQVGRFAQNYIGLCLFILEEHKYFILTPYYIIKLNNYTSTKLHSNHSSMTILNHFVFDTIAEFKLSSMAQTDGHHFKKACRSLFLPPNSIHFMTLDLTALTSVTSTIYQIDLGSNTCNLRDTEANSHLKIVSSIIFRKYILEK